jgi:hypothetical protein
MKRPRLSQLRGNSKSCSVLCSNAMAIDKIDVVSDPRIDKCTAILNGRIYGEHAVKLT